MKGKTTEAEVYVSQTWLCILYFSNVNVCMSDLKRADQRLLPVRTMVWWHLQECDVEWSPGSCAFCPGLFLAHPPTHCVVSSFVQVSAAHDVEPPVEDDVSGLCLRPHVAFCASVCVQLPLLLGSLLQSHHQYRFGSAAVDAPRDASTVDSHAQHGGPLCTASGRFSLGSLDRRFRRLPERNLAFILYFKVDFILLRTIALWEKRGVQSVWANVRIAGGVCCMLLSFSSLSRCSGRTAFSEGFWIFLTQSKVRHFIFLIDLIWSNAGNCCRNVKWLLSAQRWSDCDRHKAT